MWVSKREWDLLQKRLQAVEEKAAQSQVDCGCLPPYETNGVAYSFVSYKDRPRIRVCQCGVVFGAPRNQGYRPPPGEMCPACETKAKKRREIEKWANENPTVVEEARLKQLQEQFKSPMYFSWKQVTECEPKVVPTKKRVAKKVKRGKRKAK